MNNSAFLHNGSIGDVWASFPAMREYYRKTGIKIDLYLVNGQKAFYYEGATHPTRSESGEQVMLNLDVINKMIPLIKAQPFINDAKVWVDEEIFVDLNAIRETNVGMPYFSIQRWYFYVFPDLACDLYGKWMEVPDAKEDFAKGKIMITRSERYTNEHIDYSFIKKYEEECIFAGTMREYNNFCMAYDLNIPKLADNNFLEVAQAIKQSRFHLSNQTQALQISEGLKHPRLIEACTFAPNCVPVGEDAFDFLGQKAVEYYFEYLAKKYPAN